MPRYLRVKEIAERFRLSPDVVYKWAREGLLPADIVVRLGGSLRIDEELFLRLLARGDLSHRKPRRPSVVTLTDRGQELHP
jgi:excisionase family DNA binding protein